MNIGHTFFVTARHVVEGAFQKSADGIIGIRANGEGPGPFARFDTHLSDWRFHRDAERYVDVAVLDCRNHHRPADGRINLFHRSDPRLRDQRIKAGDPVYIPGLFYLHPGKERNIPVLRHGIIAAEPNEPIKLEVGKVDGYIIELRSMGGHSGSPVFREYWFRYDGDEQPHRDYELLGLITGSWKSPTGSQSLIADQINFGLAIVTPKDDILETMDPGGLIADELNGIAKKRIQERRGL